jgi:hypothetical protein
MVVALDKDGELALSQIKAITDKLPFNLGIMSNDHWISCFIDGEDLCEELCNLEVSGHTDIYST